MTIIFGTTNEDWEERKAARESPRVKADPEESCPSFQTPFDGSDLCRECGVEEADHA